MFISGIQLKDVEVLEGHHAFLTEAGWVIPEWLIYLRNEVTKRDNKKVKWSLKRLFDLIINA